MIIPIIPMMIAQVIGFGLVMGVILIISLKKD